MYCKFCGKKLDGQAVFCPYCGKQVAAGADLSNSRPEQPKKRKAFILLGCLGAALLVLLVVIAVFGKSDDSSKKTPSSSRGESAPAPAAAGTLLPDLEAYSGGAVQYLNTHDYSGYTMNSYSLSASDFEILSEYVRLLTQRGFSLRDSEPGDSENDIRWVFDYTGGEKVKLFTLEETDGGMDRTDMAVYLASVTTETTTDKDSIAVAFCFAGGLSLEDTGDRFGEKTSVPVASTASPSVPLPDPAVYFADWDPEPAQRSKDGSDYTVFIQFPEGADYSDIQMKTALTAYLELLEEYGFTRKGEEEEGDSQFYFFSGGAETVSRYGFEEEPASVVLTYQSAARQLMVHYSSALEVDEASPRASLGALLETKKAASTPKPTEKPEASSGKVSASSVEIPDFGAFTGIDLEGEEGEGKKHAKELDYSFKTNEKIVEEYIKLLTEKYNFKVRKDSDNIMRTVTLDYTGTGSPGTFDVRKQEGVSVYLWIYHMQHSSVHVTYADGLEYVDNGDRTTQTILQRTDIEGGSSGGGGSNNDDSTWKGGVTEIKCTKCHGEKTVPCGNCDGKGYKEKVVETANFGGGVKRETVKEKCYKCNNGLVECPRCHGTGKE